MRYLSVILVLVAGALARGDVLSAARGLGVSHLTLQEIEPLSAREGQTLVPVVLDGRSVVLEVEARSVRSENFKLVLDRGGGVEDMVEPPAPKTVRGRVIGDADSVVAGSVDGGEATLLVLTEGEVWCVQPAEDGLHAVYNERDVLDHEGTCAVPNPIAQAGRAMHRAAHSQGAPRGGGDFRIAEIAFEADWRLFSVYFGQNESALLNDVETLLAALTAIYERDVILTYELTHVLIRTSSAADPYTTNDPSALLSQFASEWNNNQQDVQRDVAHLLSGRNFSGSTIGIAFLGTICTGSSYGANQIRFSSNFNSRVALLSHELGHNWNAEHCNGQGECRIMCSGLGGCNGLGNPVRFGPFAQGQINAFIPGRTCIDNIGTDLPIVEDFEDQTLDPLAWTSQTGFDTPFDPGAPSGFRVGRLTPVFALIGTSPLETDVAPGNTIAARLWAAPESATDETFRVTVTMPDGGSRLIGVLPGDSTEYRRYAMQVPGSVLNGSTQIRFSPDSSGPAWRFDDIEIVEADAADSTVGLPLADDFERAGLFLDTWAPSTGEVTDDGAASSGSYAASLDSGWRLETADVLASGAGEMIYGVLASAPAGAGSGAELVLEWRDAQGVWQEAGRFAASSLPSDGFGLAEVTLPAAAAHDGLSVAVEAVGPAGDVWRVDDVELGGESRNECPADLAAPFGVLDLADVNAFASAFVAGEPEADLAAPFGVLDLADVNAFATSFVAGCP